MEMPETAFVLGRVAQLVDDPKKMNTIHELEFFGPYRRYLYHNGLKYSTMQLKQSGSRISEY